MATYNIKYRLEFKADKADTDGYDGVKVDFYQKDYTRGVRQYLIGSEEPLVINFVGSDRDIDAIKPCELLLNLVDVDSQANIGVPNLIEDGDSAQAICTSYFGDSDYDYKYVLDTVGTNVFIYDSAESKTTHAHGCTDPNDIAAREDHIIVVGENGNGRYSSNNGSSWGNLTTLAGSNDYKSANVSPFGDFWMVAGSSGVLWKSEDGVIFTSTTTGVSDDLHDCAFADNDNAIACGDNGTILLTSNFDAGPSWSDETSNPAHSVPTKNLYACDAYKGIYDTEYVSAGEDGMIVYKTGSGSWTQATSPTSSDIRNIQCLGHGIFYCSTGQTMYMTHDYGANWVSSISGTEQAVSLATNGRGLVKWGDATYGDYSRCYSLTQAGEYIKIDQANTFSKTDLAREFEEFDEQEFMINILGQSNSVDRENWWGWLIPDEGFVQDYGRPNPRDVQLRGTGTLGFLTKKEFRDSSGDLYTGRETPHNIVKNFFNDHYWPWTTNSLFAIYVDTMHDDMTNTGWTAPDITDAANPMKQKYWDQENFMHDSETPFTWYEVFQSMGIFYNAFWVDGYGFPNSYPSLINFEHMSYNDSEMKTIRYNNLTGVVDTITTQNYRFPLNSSTAATKNAFRGQKVSQANGIKYIDATIRSARPKSLIPDGNFEDSDWNGSSTLRNWTTEGGLTITKTSETESFSNYSVALTGSVSSKSNAKSIRSPEVSVNAGRDTKIGVSLYYHINPTSATGDTHPEIGYKLRCGQYYLAGSPHNFTWTETETTNWFKVEGDDFNAWTEYNFGRLTPPQSGPFSIELFQPFAGDYTVSNIKYDQVYAVEYFRDTPLYEDVVIEAEDTSTDYEGRISLDLDFYDFPNLAFNDYSSAVLGFSAVKFPTILNRTDGDTIGLTIDGVMQTFTYKASPSVAKEFSTDQELIDEIYDLAGGNHIATTDGDGSQPTVTVTPVWYDTAFDAGAPVFSDAGDWDNLATDHEATVAPTTDTTFISKAAPSTDSAGNSPTDWNWLREQHTGDAYKIYELILFRYMVLLRSQKARLRGQLLTFASDDEFYGPLSSLRDEDTDTEYYAFMSGQVSVKSQVWDIDTLKIRSTDPTMAFTEKSVI